MWSFYIFQEVVEDEQFGYVVMPLCEYNLKEYVQLLLRKNVLRHSAKQLLHQLFRALAFLHSKNILHRGLRPENILIDVRGHVKVADIGVGTLKYAQDVIVGRDQLVDSCCWSPPECVKVPAGAYTVCSDVHSAGMLAHYILTGGEHPYGDTPFLCLQNLVNGNKRVRFMSEEVSHLLEWMLNANPQFRPSIHCALNHPFFWSEAKRARFLEAIYVEIEVLSKYNSRVATHLNKAFQESTGSSWTRLVNMSVWEDPVIGYDYRNTLADFLRFAIHLRDNFGNVRLTTKKIIQDPLQFITTNFPFFLMSMYRCISDSQWKDKITFSEFFTE